LSGRVAQGIQYEAANATRSTYHVVHGRVTKSA